MLKIYFVEDDYIHKKECIAEMIYAYERLGSQLGMNFSCVQQIILTYIQNTRTLKSYWVVNVIGVRLKKLYAPF